MSGKHKLQMALGAVLGLALYPALCWFLRGHKPAAFLLAGAAAMFFWRRPFLLRVYSQHVQLCRETGSPFLLNNSRYLFRMSRLYTRPWSPYALAALSALAFFCFRRG